MSSDLILGVLIGAGALYLYSNKRRGGLGDFGIEAKRKSENDPETGGWAPGWRRTRDRFHTRAEAEVAVKKHGRKGAKYRIVPL